MLFAPLALGQLESPGDFRPAAGPAPACNDVDERITRGRVRWGPHDYAALEARIEAERHRVVCEETALVMADLAERLRALAVDVNTPTAPGPIVATGDVGFESFHKAARFLIDNGAFNGSLASAAALIKRAAISGRRWCGRDWQLAGGQKCPFCGKPYVRTYALADHIRREHPEHAYDADNLAVKLANAANGRGEVSHGE
jgi:hypothetical protein